MAFFNVKINFMIIIILIVPLAMSVFSVSWLTVRIDMTRANYLRIKSGKIKM